jgi:hypothetical protein
MNMTLDPAPTIDSLRVDKTATSDRNAMTIDHALMRRPSRDVGGLQLSHARLARVPQADDAATGPATFSNDCRGFTWFRMD